MFNVGDIVTFEESIPGEIIDVMVDKDNDTVYLVLFENGTTGVFLAKDLKLVEKRD
jgi:hypothetical protein